MPSAFVPFGDRDRNLMWKVLSLWVEGDVLPANDLVRTLRSTFNPARADFLGARAPHYDHPIKLIDLDVWIVGAQLSRQEGVYPVVTFKASGTKDAVDEAAFRVAFIRELEDGLEATGWRFEQAEEYDSEESVSGAEDDEDDTAAHPYSHAQAIIGWEKGINCLIHAPHGESAQCTGLHPAKHYLIDVERIRVQSQTLVKHPAFPLGVHTLTGLALAVFTTLYGARRARKLFGGVRSLKTATGLLRADLEALSIVDASVAPD